MDFNGHDISEPPDEMEDSETKFDSIEHRTDKATLFRHEDKTWWFPNRYINIDEENKIVHYEGWLYMRYIK
jgi:hypothetical protein